MLCVEDALNSIEYVSGTANSTWGSVRASMGHPEAWNLTYMAIGNEASPGSLCRYWTVEQSIRRESPTFACDLAYGLLFQEGGGGLSRKACA